MKIDQQVLDAVTTMAVTYEINGLPEVAKTLRQFLAEAQEPQALTMTDDALKRFGQSQYRDGYAQATADLDEISGKQRAGFERCFEALGIAANDDRERSWSSLVLAIEAAKESKGRGDLNIVEIQRDGNWREFSVNGHGGVIRVVGRMEDANEDLPLGEQIAQFLLDSEVKLKRPKQAPTDLDQALTEVADFLEAEANLSVISQFTAISEWIDGRKTKVHEVLQWLETEVSGVDCHYNDLPGADHDAYYMRDQVLKLVKDAREIFPESTPFVPLSAEQIQRAMVMTPHYDDDEDYAHYVRMGANVITLFQRVNKA